MPTKTRKVNRYKEVFQVRLLPEHLALMDSEMGARQRSAVVRMLLRGFLEGQFNDEVILGHYVTMSRVSRSELIRTSFTIDRADYDDLKIVVGIRNVSKLIRALLEYHFALALERRRKKIRGKKRASSQLRQIREALQRLPRRFTPGRTPTIYVPGVAAVTYDWDVPSQTREG